MRIESYHNNYMMRIESYAIIEILILIVCSDVQAGGPCTNDPGYSGRISYSTIYMKQVYTVLHV